MTNKIKSKGIGCGYEVPSIMRPGQGRDDCSNLNQRKSSVRSGHGVPCPFYKGIGVVKRHPFCGETVLPVSFHRIFSLL
jgi:hypothetical protein